MTTLEPMASQATCADCGKAPGNPACASCRHSTSNHAGPPDTRLAPVAPGSGPVQRERRDIYRQEPRVGGARVTDPRLTTRDCAERLGMSARFIVGEIRDGRLAAHVREREGLRALYRISEVAFDAYLQRYWPSALRRDGKDGSQRR